MSTRANFVSSALCLLLAVGACASRQTVGERIDDSTLKMRVGRALLADPQAARLGVDVDVIDGIVFLKGEVESEQEKIQAGKVAANTVGVVEVKNDLQVEGTMPEGEDDRSDFGIRSSVGSLLMTDPDVKRFEIDVDVVNGVVYLSGVVEDERAKAAAERIARGVEGVREVKNQLEVEEVSQEPAPGGEEPAATPESEPMDEPMDESMPQD